LLLEAFGIDSIIELFSAGVGFAASPKMTCTLSGRK
jgi:hypothetical protein